MFFLCFFPWVFNFTFILTDTSYIAFSHHFIFFLSSCIHFSHLTFYFPYLYNVLFYFYPILIFLFLSQLKTFPCLILIKPLTYIFSIIASLSIIYILMSCFRYFFFVILNDSFFNSLFNSYYLAIIFYHFSVFFPILYYVLYIT